MKKALLSLLFFSVIPAFAFDPILLQCMVTGTRRSPGITLEKKFSEIIEIDVSGSAEEIVFDINGPTMSGLHRGRTFVGKAGTQFSGKNVNSSDAWKFRTEAIRSNGVSRFETGRIDRRTGSFTYDEKITTLNKDVVITVATGTCSKQSNIKKF